MSIINERIKELRLKNNLTLLEVADALGVKEATAQRYESGAIRSISHETICKLSELFHCSPSYLMGWDSNDDLEQALDLYQKYLRAPEQARLTIDYILKLQQPDSESQQMLIETK